MDPKQFFSAIILVQSFQCNHFSNHCNHLNAIVFEIIVAIIFAICNHFCNHFCNHLSVIIFGIIFAICNHFCNHSKLPKLPKLPGATGPKIREPRYNSSNRSYRSYRSYRAGLGPKSGDKDTITRLQVRTPKCKHCLGFFRISNK